MRAEERRREGCRKKKLKLPGVHFSHPSSRKGLQTTTSAHREWGGASQDWHLTPARGCHRGGNCAETPHICFSIGATILRSEESVAKATSLLGRTLRRASHAESERASLSACVPASVRARATAKPKRSRQPHSSSSSSGGDGSSSGGIFSHDYPATAQSTTSRSWAEACNVTSAASEFAWRGIYRGFIDDVPEKTLEKTWAAATTGGPTQVTLPGCQNHQDPADTDTDTGCFVKASIERDTLPEANRTVSREIN